MSALPSLGLVTGAVRADVCAACGSAVEVYEVRYRWRSAFWGRIERATAWQKSEHRCVPIAADGCADPYCDGEAHAGGGA